MRCLPKIIQEIMDEIEINKNCTLAELTSVDWGLATDTASSIVRERHDLRRKKIVDLDSESIDKLLKLEFEGDAKYLIPIAIASLRSQDGVWKPEAQSLVETLLSLEPTSWEGNEVRKEDLLEVGTEFLNKLDDEIHYTESLANLLESYKSANKFLTYQNSLLNKLFHFQRQHGNSS